MKLHNRTQLQKGKQRLGLKVKLINQQSINPPSRDGTKHPLLFLCQFLCQTIHRVDEILIPEISMFTPIPNQQSLFPFPFCDLRLAATCSQPNSPLIFQPTISCIKEM